MNSNPYEAPQAQTLETQAPMNGSGRFSIRTSLSEAWEAATSNALLLIGSMIVFILLSFLSAITIIGYFLILPVLSWGAIRLGFEVYDGRGDFNTLFSGFKEYGKALGRMLLLGILLFLISLPGSIVSIYADIQGGDNVNLILIGMAISLAYSVVMVRLYFAPYFAVEGDRNAVGALQAAWSSTSGLWLRVIGLTILSALVAMSGVILLGVGMLFTVPLSYLMMISAYRQMVGRGTESA
jgi:hypothetical protein